MRSYQKEREAFIYRAGADFRLSFDEARIILGEAGALQRAAEVQCSVDQTEEQAARLERRIELSQRVIFMIWTRHFPHGFCDFQGDPRGAVVKLRKNRDDKGDSWGGDGWCVPAQGYRSSQIERMCRNAGRFA